MTFKVKNGLAVGSISVVDTNSFFQQTENVSTVPPSLVLDFTSKTLDSRIEFTRNSIGTFVNANGFIQTAAANVPRFDYNPTTRECRGYLSEEQRTNLLTYSENLSLWGGGGTSTLDAAIVDPTGANNTVYYNTISERYMSFDGGSANTLAMSFFMKPRTGSGSTRTRVEVFQQTSGTVVSLGAYDFDVASANPDTTHVKGVTVTPYINDWYRVGFYVNANTSTGAGNFSSSSRFDFEGGGYSNYVWGAQVERGKYVTSYIPTTASTVTRVDDDARMTGNNFLNFINRFEGTVVCEFQTNSNMTANEAVATWNRYPSPWAVSGFVAGSSFSWYGTQAELYLNGTYNNVGAVPSGSVKTAFAVANTGGQSAIAINGVASNKTGTVWGRDLYTFTVGTGGSGVSVFGGTIKSLSFYPKRLPDATLINLTSS